jgi:hypothetical protein
MQLALSSAAAPDLSLEALLEGCRRRGLAGLELVARGAPPSDAAAIATVCREGGITLLAVALLDDQPASLDTGLSLARELGVAALLPASAASLNTVRRHIDAGGRLLLRHGTDGSAAAAARETVAALPAGTAALAWEVDPGRDEAVEVPLVLAETGADLAYIRLRGGGPESEGQTGLGVGALMARLALGRYSGPIVLTPSTPSYHHVWRTWLSRDGGWGCGSKRSDPSLVVLPGVGAATPEAHR